MASNLSKYSQLRCPHGGIVTIVASPRPNNTITAADTYLIAGCPFMISSTPKPCVSVKWLVANSSAPLTTACVGQCLSAAKVVQGQVVIIVA